MAVRTPSVSMLLCSRTAGFEVQSERRQHDIFQPENFGLGAAPRTLSHVSTLRQRLSMRMHAVAVPIIVTVMTVVMCVPMIVTVTLPAAGAVVRVAMSVMMIMTGLVMVVRRRQQRRRDLAFDAGCLLARRALVLDRHCHDLGCQHDVIRSPEIVAP